MAGAASCCWLLQRCHTASQQRELLLLPEILLHLLLLLLLLLVLQQQRLRVGSGRCRCCRRSNSSGCLPARTAGAAVAQRKDSCCQLRVWFRRAPLAAAAQLGAATAPAAVVQPRQPQLPASGRAREQQLLLLLVLEVDRASCCNGCGSVAAQLWELMLLLQLAARLQRRHERKVCCRGCRRCCSRSRSPGRSPVGRAAARAVTIGVSKQAWHVEGEHLAVCMPVDVAMWLHVAAMVEQRLLASSHPCQSKACSRSRKKRLV